MNKRFVSLYFHHLMTDWFSLRKPQLRNMPFVLALPDHGRMVITQANKPAEAEGIRAGMVVADARVMAPALEVLDDQPAIEEKLLLRLAAWCVRFAPYVSIDPPAGLILDATGCAHLWGGDGPYVADLVKRLQARGYQLRIGMADTIGAAWAIARYSKASPVVEPGNHAAAILHLPTAALRIDTEMAEKLYKLGIRDIKDLVAIPRPALRRRFGKELIKRIDQALGQEEEFIQPVQEFVPYQERLPCLEPVVTLPGIEMALNQLLENLCRRLQNEGKGLRSAVFSCHRIDNKIEKIAIGTNRPANDPAHLFKLFELKLQEIEPALGIELFVLEAQKVQDCQAAQNKLWEKSGGLHDPHLVQLLDRLAGRFGADRIVRYLPDEHYWPERSFKAAASLEEQPGTAWPTGKRRPLHLLQKPQPIEVTAPIPDYPPMLFRYRGVLHKVIRADGPERIEQEWWLQQGKHRDYYCVEDDKGCRYWIFRSGHYDAAKTWRWYIHGFFA